jgi:hypothetical protein
LVARRTNRYLISAHILRAGQENLTDRQHARLVAAFTSDERHVEVEVAWSCAQQVRAAYHQGRLPPGQPRRRTNHRREDPRHLCLLPDPRSRPPRSHTAAMAQRVPRLLRHPRRLQRRHGSHQRPDRAPPPHRPRLPQPGQLSTPDAPHRRRPAAMTPHSSVKSHQSRPQRLGQLKANDLSVRTSTRSLSGRLSAVASAQ